jgi:hypothetical protein
MNVRVTRSERWKKIKDALEEQAKQMFLISLRYEKRYSSLN